MKHFNLIFDLFLFPFLLIKQFLYGIKNNLFQLFIVLMLFNTVSYGTTFSVRTASASDAAEERISNGSVNTTSSDLELVYDGHPQAVGIRFKNITIPQGTTITNAYIQFHADGETRDTPVSLVIHGDKVDNAPTFGGDYDITGRTATDAVVPWDNILKWTGNNDAKDEQKTPNLKPIVQEILNRSGWNSGNSMAFIFNGDDTKIRRAETHHGDEESPTLYIQYGAACTDYDSDNNECPGATVLSMDQITDNTQSCIYGSSTNGDEPDYYKFTVQAFGTLDVTGTSTNSHRYHLYAGSRCGGEEFYADTTSSEHTIPTIDLIPGDTVYFSVKETGSDTDEYELNFNFIKDTVFHAKDDTYSIPPDLTATLTVLRNDNPGDNAPLNTGSLTIVSAPTKGTYSISDGAILYTPNNGITDTTDTFTYTIEDSIGTVSNTATVTIHIGTVLLKGDRDFTPKNPKDTRNINGNYIVGGNMNLCEEDPNNLGNCRTDNSNSNSRDDIYIDIDEDTNTKNSTSFDLNVPDGGTVVWAGLYWQGVVHRSRSEDGGDDFMGGTVPNDAPLMGGSTNQIDLTNNTYDADKVKFKLPGQTTYTEITANQLYYSKLGYGGFADVTSLIAPDNPNGTYMLADIKCHTGAEPNHGNYGGWSLVVIYKDPIEQFKNVTIFDGFATVDSSYRGNLEIDGFLTPKIAPINSKIAFFTMDGEGGSGGTLKVISENLVETFVSNSENPWNRVFNSTITGVNNRLPAYPSLRLDLDVFDLSNALGTNETKATLQPRSGGDRYTASYFIMSSDLISPQLCYDYDLHVGDVKVYSDNRHIDAETRGDQPLEIKVLIRSMVSDFSVENARAHITFTPTPNTLNSNKGFIYKYPGWSKVSPSGINAYIDAIETNTSIGQIAIGHDQTITGGIINSDESTYFKQFFDFNDTNYEGTFDIIIQGEIDYLQNGDPFTYNLSTKNSSIEQCPTNATYDPIELYFNIENANAAGTDPEWERHPLYTQVTGRDYQVVLTSYSKATDGTYSEANATNATVEVELIDASSYDNNATTGYDSTCQEPTAASEGGFVRFNNNSRQVFEPFNLNAFGLPSTYNQKLALRSAAFRIWILTKFVEGESQRSVVQHDCGLENSSPSCFNDLYASEYQDSEDNETNYCSVDSNEIEHCGPGSSESSCYNCLRKYFAIPICSRDNFSIRPESFLINVGDNNDSHDENINTLWFAGNKSGKDNKNLAAGYEYFIEVNATIFENTDTISEGYHSDLFKTETYTTLPDNFEFDGLPMAAFKFDQSGTCDDTNSSTLGLRFYNSSLEIKQYFRHHNVGRYKFTIADSNWTEVDQARYENKTEFGNGKIDDCDITSSNPDMIHNEVGCTIYSVQGSKTEMAFNLKPYSFDLSSVQYYTRPNTSNDYLYMNNLESTNVDDRMAAKMEGNITAIGKDGSLLSNFTDACAAEDVMLWVDRTMNPTESTITGENGSDINFQQGLKNYLDMLNVVNNSNNNDINSTLSSSNFFTTSDRVGGATVDLYFNFAKPYDEPVNVVDVNFSMLHAASPNSISNADQLADHIADGNNTAISRPHIYFYYAKVAPAIGTDGRQVFSPDTTTSTTLRVNTFCHIIPGINCGVLPGIPSSAEEINWYRMENHVSSLGDGQVNSLSSTESNVKFNGVNPVNNISFDTNGSTSGITISYPLTGRPAHPVIVIDPEEWLKYNSTASKNGLPEFIIHFLKQGLKWKGTGQTGHVIETEPSVGSSKRLNW